MFTTVCATKLQTYTKRAAHRMTFRIVFVCGFSWSNTFEMTITNTQEIFLQLIYLF